MTAETKLRTLAAADTALQAIFGTAPFRWWDTGLVQKSAFPSVVVRRISTIRQYTHDGLNVMSQPRFQFEVRHPDSETARAAAAAVITFLGTADLASNAQFGSPVTTPRQYPSFVLNQMTRTDSSLLPPVWVEVIDARMFNLEN